MLFDPFEKQFNLPSMAVELGDGLGGDVEVVGEVNIGSVGFVVMVFYSSESLYIDDYPKFE